MVSYYHRLFVALLHLGWFTTLLVLPMVAVYSFQLQNARTYATDFPLDENPISEGGVWQHRGASWAVVRTFASRAVDSQTGFGGYDDTYAYLTDFGPNQTHKRHCGRIPLSETTRLPVRSCADWSGAD